MPDSEAAATEDTVKKTLSAGVGDLVFKLLAAAVIPLAVWLINVNSELATKELRIRQLETQVAELKPNTNSLIRLEERVKTMTGTLDEIKDLLNRPHVPSP